MFLPNMAHMTYNERSDLQPRLSSVVPRKAVEQRQAVGVHPIRQLQPEAGHQCRVAAGHLLRIGAPEVDAIEANDRLLYIRNADH